MRRNGLFTLLGALLTFTSEPARAQTLLWARQAGTLANDVAQGVDVGGASRVYVTGYTYGNLGGTNAGLGDAYLTQYDTSGTLLWTRQTGSSADDYANDVAVDIAGNAYVTGYTSGNLGGANVGLQDVFVAKYNTSGTLLWMLQTGSPAEDYAMDVAVDTAGNAYVAGYTRGSLAGANAGQDDIYLAKYDASGIQLWTRQIGTSTQDFAMGVAVDDAGNAYITGHTFGSLGAANAGLADICLVKYDAVGVRLWTRQFGTSRGDYANGVAVDVSGNTYITGYTLGNLGGTNAGHADICLVKHDAEGSRLWTRQFGTSEQDYAMGVAVDDSGNACITGYTSGSLGGTNAGDFDAFVSKYDGLGVRLWTRQTGTSDIDYSMGVALDGTGNAYIAGFTFGSLGGANAGLRDTYTAKYGFCPADFNLDGFVTGQDYDLYVQAFENGEVAADFDSDGFITGVDFDHYVQAFEADC